MNSIEIRWFVPGEAPREFLDWVQGDALGPHPRKHEERPDSYLVGADDGLNVKLREGQMQIKWRSEQVPISAGRLAGVRERWEKWSWRGDDAALGDRIAGAPFVTVQKERWLAKYALTGGGLEPVTTDARPEFGCAVELARLDAAGTRVWSVCLETFAFDERSAEALDETLARVGESVPDASHFTADSSYGYARWLSTLV